MKPFRRTSVTIAILCWLAFGAGLLVLPEFKMIFHDLGIPLPPITKLILGVYPLWWFVLSGVGLTAPVVKDFYLKEERHIMAANTICVILAFCLGSVIVIAMFMPLIGSVQRL